jgi:hypothetical protein
MLEERPVSQNTDPHSGQVWTYSVSKTRVILTFLPVTAPTRLRTLRLVCPLAVAVGCNPLIYERIVLFSGSVYGILCLARGKGEITSARLSDKPKDRAGDRAFEGHHRQPPPSREVFLATSIRVPKLPALWQALKPLSDMP